MKFQHPCTPSSDVCKVHPHQTQLSASTYNQPSSLDASEPLRKWICGIDSKTFWFGVTLTIVTILVTTGAGVAGSLAVRRQHQWYVRTNPWLDVLGKDCKKSRLEPSIPTAATTTTTTTVTPSNASPQASTSAPSPSSDCSSLGSRYKAQGYANQLFDISCRTDYPGSDMEGLFVLTFEACIEACASYNQMFQFHTNTTCGGVSFDPTMTLSEGGDFWLKSGQTNLTSHPKTQTHSAKTSESG